MAPSRLVVAILIAFYPLPTASNPSQGASLSKPLLSGPLILPPSGNETSRLWDITSAFREAVKLGILKEKYSSDGKVQVSLSIPTEEKGSDEPYSLSLQSSPAAKRQKTVTRKENGRILPFVRPLSKAFSTIGKYIPEGSGSGSSYSLSMRPAFVPEPPRMLIAAKPPPYAKKVKESYSLSIRPALVTAPSNQSTSSDKSNSTETEVNKTAGDPYSLSLRPVMTSVAHGDSSAESSTNSTKSSENVALQGKTLTSNPSFTNEQMIPSTLDPLGSGRQTSDNTFNQANMGSSGSSPVQATTASQTMSAGRMESLTCQNAANTNDLKVAPNASQSSDVRNLSQSLLVGETASLSDREDTVVVPDIEITANASQSATPKDKKEVQASSEVLNGNETDSQDGAGNKTNAKRVFVVQEVSRGGDVDYVPKDERNTSTSNTASNGRNDETKNTSKTKAVPIDIRQPLARGETNSSSTGHSKILANAVKSTNNVAVSATETVDGGSNQNTLPESRTATETSANGDSMTTVDHTLTGVHSRGSSERNRTELEALAYSAVQQVPAQQIADDVGTAAERSDTSFPATPNQSSANETETIASTHSTLQQENTGLDDRKTCESKPGGFSKDPIINPESASDTMLDYSVSLRTVSEVTDGTDAKTTTPAISIRAYAADHFARLRSLFGITEAAFQKSLLESGHFVSFQSNSKGAARIGGVFFFSPDGSYLVKTIKKDEVPTLLRMLPKYCSFMEENGRKTLLTRFCGMYDVCFGKERHTLVIMNSVFPASSAGQIEEKFDLKGSTLGRECSEEERLSKGKDAILKDLDLAKEMNVEDQSNDIQRGIFALGSSRKAALFDQLKRDIALLVSCSVIDYSLLVGVEPVAQVELQTGSSVLTAKGTRSSDVDGGELSIMEGLRKGLPAVYYFGLIDFLQPFNAKKMIEWRVKSFLHEKDTFSCVPPEVYATRLLDFLDKHIA